jgi:hypothetical protein
MDSVDKAKETQLANIEKKTGKSRKELMNEVGAASLVKHREILEWLKETYALGHGDANAIAHFILRGGSLDLPEHTAADDVLDIIYKDKKAHQRPIHEALMTGINTFGAFETSPKQGYVSLRRKKQFAMLGPKTNERFELGLNLKDAIDDPRVKAVPAGGMCQYVVPLSEPSQVDASLIALIRRAYDAAG